MDKPEIKINIMRNVEHHHKANETIIHAKDRTVDIVIQVDGETIYKHEDVVAKVNMDTYVVAEYDWQGREI